MRAHSVAAFLLLWIVSIAHADTVSTYEVRSQTEKNDLGTVRIDETSGVILNFDLPVTIGSTNVIFDGQPAAQAFSPYTNEYIATVSQDGYDLQFNLDTDTLVDYDPAAKAKCKNKAEFCDYLANVFSGPEISTDLADTFEGNLIASTPASVTPEPSSIALLGTGLLSLGGLLRKRVVQS